MATSDDVRFNLVLPAKLYANLKAMADAKGVTVTQLLRQFAQIGLMVLDESGGQSKFLIRRNNVDAEVKLIL